MPVQPDVILSLGYGSGAKLSALAQQFPKAEFISVNMAEPKQNTPLPSLAANSVDLIAANMLLHWCDDFAAVFAEVKRVLKPKGLFFFSLLGPDTLRELSACWQQATGKQPANPLIDMHHIGDQLTQHGFIHPVMEMEYLTLTYKDFAQFWWENEQLGFIPLVLQRTPEEYNAMKQQIQTHYQQWQDKQQRLPATFELIYGHAWQPETVGAGGAQEEGNEVRIPVGLVKRKG